LRSGPLNYDAEQVIYGVNPLLADFDGTAILSRFPVLSHQAWPLYHYGAPLLTAAVWGRCHRRLCCAAM
jgi:hypothetical protein